MGYRMDELTSAAIDQQKDEELHDFLNRSEDATEETTVEYEFKCAECGELYEYQDKRFGNNGADDPCPCCGGYIKSI